MGFFEPPARIEAEVFAKVPDRLRKGGAPSITPCAQFSVQSVAGAPSKFQNCVVPYIAWTGWPALPAP